MPLERTHNVDGNASRATGTTIYTAPGVERVVTMGIADAEAIYSMLSDLSANKGAYVLRETYSNAHDATMRAGDMTRPIEIDLTDAHDADGSNLVMKLASSTKCERTLTVTDHGTGMSADEIAVNFLQYGGSDKRDEADSIGSKGLGSKAPLAVTESFVVTSTKDGMTTTAIVERTPKKAGQGRLVTKRTNASNGTTVQIPVPDGMTFRQMQQFLVTLRTYNTDANLVINGRPAQRSLPDARRDFTKPYVYVGEAHVGDQGQCPIRIWEANRKNGRFSASTWPIMGDRSKSVSLAVVIGGVPYTLDGHHISSDENGAPSENVIVELQPGWLDFTPSRDEIKQNAAATQMLRAIMDGRHDLDYSQDLAHLLCNDDDAFVRFLVALKLRDETAHPYASRYTIADYRKQFMADMEDDGSIHIGRYVHRHRSRQAGTPNGATLTIESLDHDGHGEDRMALMEKALRKTAHIIATEPMSANTATQDVKRAMSLDGHRIVKGQMSKVSMSESIEPEQFTELLVSELELNGGRGHTCIVTGIADNEGLHRMMRAENDYRLSNPRTNAPTAHVSYVLCESLAELDEAATWLMRRLNVEVVTLDEVETKAKSTRLARNRARRREYLAIQAAMEDTPLPKLQSNWTAQNVTVASIESDHSVTWYLEAAMAVPYRYSNVISYRNRSLGAIIRDSHDGMANVALVATDSDEHEARRAACEWAARLSALRVAGNFPLDPRVNCVVGLAKNTPTGLIKGLMARGASLISDDRTTIKTPIENTLLRNRPEIIDSMGHMSAPLLFDADDPEPAIWAVLSDQLVGQLAAKDATSLSYAANELRAAHRTSVSLARLVSDLLADAEVSDMTKTTVMEPLQTLFSRRDANRDENSRPYRYRGKGSAHYMRQYEDDLKIIIPDQDHPAPRLKDVPELAMRMERAVDLAARASYFMALPWIADQKNESIKYQAFPDSKAIDEMRPIIAPIILQRLEDLVSTEYGDMTDAHADQKAKPDGSDS